METCKYCKKEINYKMSAHRNRCVTYRSYLNASLSKEYLNREYVNKQRSANAISKDIGTTPARVIKALKDHNIQTRTIKQSTSTKNVKNEREKTNLEKYGHKHNFCKKHPSRKVWEDNLKKNGYDNVFQRPDVKLKSAQTIMAKYGVKSCMELDWVKDKLKTTMLDRYGVDSPLELAKKTRITKPHKKIIEYLKSLNIEYTIEHTIFHKERRFHVDILIGDSIIEIYGDFWHGNPKKYKSGDILNFPSKKILVDDIWERDNEREALLQETGRNMLTLWEYDINNEFNKTKEKICNYLKLNQSKSLNQHQSDTI